MQIGGGSNLKEKLNQTDPEVSPFDIANLGKGGLKTFASILPENLMPCEERGKVISFHMLPHMLHVDHWSFKNP